MASPYVELHLHSCFSLLDAPCQLDSIVTRAAALGYPCGRAWNRTGPLTASRVRSTRPQSPRSPACFRPPRSPPTRPEHGLSSAGNAHTPARNLNAIEERDGYRYTGLATDTRAGQHAFLDARHRADARVEDRIRTGRDTGLGRLPSRSFAINAA